MRTSTLGFWPARSSSGWAAGTGGDPAQGGRTMARAGELNDRYRQVLALQQSRDADSSFATDSRGIALVRRACSRSRISTRRPSTAVAEQRGACYARLGQFERALETQRRAVALHETRGDAGPYEQALGELGSTYLLMEDLAQGVPYLTKALAVAEQAGLNGRCRALGEESRGRRMFTMGTGTRRSASTRGAATAGNRRIRAACCSPRSTQPTLPPAAGKTRRRSNCSSRSSTSPRLKRPCAGPPTTVWRPSRAAPVTPAAPPSSTMPR